MRIGSSYRMYICKSVEMMWQLVIRTEGVSVGIIRMLCQLVGVVRVERVIIIIRTEGISVRIIKMLGQLVRNFPVERLINK